MMPMRAGDTRYARARIELELGRARSAANLAREAVRQYEKSGTPIDAAQARVLLGRILASSGKNAAARRELDTALAVSNAHGAADMAARAREARTRLDGTAAEPDRTPVSAFDGLTRRQQEIVGRVVRGLTNRQIAEELFVSEKTVEAHLSRLFTRLNVSSRAALAAVAAVEYARRS
ncbi:LuxR C-terminal-related transcriptional regulator [Nocardia fusca]|uniref:LuxR C-terminal-related transcriptional regulator n=1 Tax=Nocardia fusca TaxID=941183 RepID=UPI000B15EF1F|nr:LuxR C-terminal-related transcriptional regulator [Nocardia fusca]